MILDVCVIKSKQAEYVRSGSEWNISPEGEEVTEGWRNSMGRKFTICVT
jgi:hypothetical protein